MVGVALAIRVSVGVGGGLGISALGDSVGVADRTTEPVVVAVGVRVGVAVRVAGLAGDTVKVDAIVGVRLGSGDRVGEAVNVAVGVAVGSLVTLGVGSGEAVALGDAVGVAVSGAYKRSDNSDVMSATDERPSPFTSAAAHSTSGGGKRCVITSVRSRPSVVPSQLASPGAVAGTPLAATRSATTGATARNATRLRLHQLTVLGSASRRERQPAPWVLGCPQHREA
jgi:hypothetical protein